ncbi:MAG TPA: hypothetical protein VLB46_11255 [Pyrinomonadaceae bacterium]|nr:hypothetical protein [Pyrinomonadaceae bacterium]
MKYIRTKYRRIPLGLKALLVAVALITSGLVLFSRYAEAANLGQGKVVNVVPVNTECVSGPVGNGVQSWDVQQGGTYDVTIAGVTDAGNGGTDGTIEVIVKNSETGNQCLTAFKQATGVYKFTITMPTEACNTFPITYGSTGCEESTALFARRNDGGNFQSHLRAATFDGSCNKTGNDTECVVETPKGEIAACKYYDFNANGVFDPGEQGLDGWPMTINPLDGATPNQATQLTTAGCAVWTTLDPAFNPYTITEGTPVELNWFHSTPISQTVTVVGGQREDVVFGNYCKVPSGGLTLGFWSNKNGQALINAGDLLALRNLCLRNADGSNFDPTTNAQVKSFLLGANATNMANMLSAQLTAMTLNIRHGFVDPNAFDLCSNKTVGQLTTDANTSLCANGLTFSGSPDRAPQEAMKNCIDALNNGGPVVPTTPCSRTFP